MKRALLVAAAVAISTLDASPAGAQTMDRVTDVTEFNAILAGRKLRLGIMGIALTVAPDGSVSGTASGFPVTGSWAWENGFFCRSMTWGGTEIPYNCQLIEFGGGRMRITSDQGAGDQATFNVH